MKIDLQLLDEQFLMEARNEGGQTLRLDASTEVGGAESAFRPMQALLASLGGCSSIDVLHILRKQRENPHSFSLSMEAEREKMGDYSLFRRIVLHFRMGGVPEAKARRAIELSLEKYCSVAKTLEPTAAISYTLELL